MQSCTLLLVAMSSDCVSVYQLNSKQDTNTHLQFLISGYTQTCTCSINCVSLTLLGITGYTGNLIVSVEANVMDTCMFL